MRTVLFSDHPIAVIDVEDANTAITVALRLIAEHSPSLRIMRTSSGTQTPVITTRQCSADEKDLFLERSLAWRGEVSLAAILLEDNLDRLFD